MSLGGGGAVESWGPWGGGVGLEERRGLTPPSLTDAKLLFS